MVRETDGGSEQERDYIYLIKIPLGDQLSEGDQYYLPVKCIF